MEYSFKKSVCEKYEVSINKHDYMTFTIDDSGLFQAYGSYGSYNFQWSSHGRKSFKHFILDLAKDTHYFLKKVGEGNYFYQKETKEAWKKQIILDRRGKEFESIGLTKEEARTLWNIVDGIDYNSAEGCQRQLYDNNIVWEKYCEPWYYFEPVVGYSPNERYFAKEVMPIFAEIIKKEVENNE